MLREINQQLAEKNTQLESFVAAMQLDQLHLQDHDYLKLPKSLLECCAGVSVRQTALVKTEIPALMKSIVAASMQAKSMLDDVQELLEEEHRTSSGSSKQRVDSDDSYSSDASESSGSSEVEERRAGMARPNKKRPPVSERKRRSRDLIRRYERLLKNYQDANQSNTQLREAFDLVIKDLQMLALPLR